MSDHKCYQRFSYLYFLESQNDKIFLKQLENTAIDTFPGDAVHLYPTNAQVAKYNKEQLDKLPLPHITVMAKDLKKDMYTNSTEITIQSDNIYIKLVDFLLP